MDVDNQETPKKVKGVRSKRRPRRSPSHTTSNGALFTSTTRLDATTTSGALSAWPTSVLATAVSGTTSTWPTSVPDTGVSGALSSLATTAPDAAAVGALFASAITAVADAHSAQATTESTTPVSGAISALATAVSGALSARATIAPATAVSGAISARATTVPSSIISGALSARATTAPATSLAVLSASISDNDPTGNCTFSSFEKEMADALLLLAGRTESNSKPKLHKCSVCSVEFPSGQALGGHKRLHYKGVIRKRVLAVADLAPTEARVEKKSKSDGKKAASS